MNYANAVDPEAKRIDPDLFTRAWDLTLDPEPWRVPAIREPEKPPPSPTEGTVSREIYEILLSQGPLTYAEVCRYMGSDRGVSSKLQALWRGGFIEPIGKRPNLKWSAVA